MCVLRAGLTGLGSTLFYFKSMNNPTKHIRVVSAGNARSGCLSCGTVENIGRRKYCSIDCRQRLRHTLNRRTGLLRALHTRYATFYFTPVTIILDILPFGSREIFSFIYPRRHKAKPAEDFSRMADMLGNVWWAERRRTNKKYRAAQLVFDQARRQNSQNDEIQPLEIRLPSVKDKSLIHLKLGRKDLQSSQLRKIIKNAYRRQAKKHHPDLGGDSYNFQRIHRAYEELITWAESPTFVRRRGFPDKWFYNGDTNRWVQPTPSKNT